MLTKIKRFFGNVINNRLKFPWYSKSDSYISYWIENPFKTWWKARKYFKRPKIRFCFASSHYYRIGKILDISIADVQWKDKFNTPRHEHSPKISIRLFRRFEFSILFTIYYQNEFGEKQNGDMYYWEYLLEWLHYKNKESLKCYHTWVGDSKLYNKVLKWGDNEGDDPIEIQPYPRITPVVAMSLNKNGIKQLKKELNNG